MSETVVSVHVQKRTTINAVAVIALVKNVMASTVAARAGRANYDTASCAATCETDKTCCAGLVARGSRAKRTRKCGADGLHREKAVRGAADGDGCEYAEAEREGGIDQIDELIN